MSRIRALERARLARLEARLAGQAEARAVAEGVAETVALSRARGQAIAEPAPATRRGAYRRQTGLAWLTARGRISPVARATGERYGEVWRRVRMDAKLPCSLEVLPGGGPGGGPGLAQVLAHGAQTERARKLLARLRARLSHQPDLVAVCDAVCGEEKTPREAAAGERDAARVEALLKVALDLMAGAG